MQRCLQSPAAIQTAISKHLANLLFSKTVFYVITASLINDAEIPKVLIKAVFYVVSTVFKKKDINQHNKILLEHAPKKY